MGEDRKVTSEEYEELEREELRVLEEFGRGLEEIRRSMREPTPRNFAKTKIYNARTHEEIAEARSKPAHKPWALSGSW